VLSRARKQGSDLHFGLCDQDAPLLRREGSVWTIRAAAFQSVVSKSVRPFTRSRVSQGIDKRNSPILNPEWKFGTFRRSHWRTRSERQQSPHLSPS